MRDDEVTSMASNRIMRSVSIQVPVQSLDDGSGNYRLVWM